MCEACNQPSLDIEAEMDAYQEKLETLAALHSSREELTAKDREFADSLYTQFVNTKGLSPNQWTWVGRLLERIKKSEPVSGNFNPVQVMFRMVSAAEGGAALKKPKIRLLSKNERYVQLNFDITKPEAGINVYVDGWAGHGYRKFAGWIKDGKLVPYRTDRMTPDVIEVIQQFSDDPIQTAKAMAGLLGVCMYCGQRLSDDRSKQAGYGPVCAKTWHLPW